MVNFVLTMVMGSFFTRCRFVKLLVIKFVANCVTRSNTLDKL